MTTTTSWIWMKGVSPKDLQTKSPPVTEWDDRPFISDLITKHMTTIVSVKSELARESKLYDETKHDDLWILRFVMSHKNKVKPAVKAAKETLEFRAKYQLDEKDIRYESWSPESSNPSVRLYSRYMKGDGLVMVLPDAQRGVVMYFDMIQFDFEAMVANLTQEDWLGAFIFCNEWAFQWQDYITRTTGRLTKSVRMIDMSTFSMKHMNKEANKRDAYCMGLMEDCYPQLLQSLMVCDPPIWINIPWSIFKLLLPKRVLEKFDMITPKKKPKDLNKLRRFIADSNLPEKFGGTNAMWPPVSGKFPPPPK